MRAWALVALAAALLVASCGGQSAATPPSPSRTPVADYGTPPAGVPLLYVRDPKHATWLIAYDWQGQPRGTVKLAAYPSQAYLAQAPDGQGFEEFSPKGNQGWILDRLGQPVPNDVQRFIGGKWADDARHTCGVAFDQQAFTWTLMTTGAGEATRAVTVIATDQGIGQTSLGMAACSYKNDVAIVGRQSIAWPAELWVVRLSDGKHLSHSPYTPTSLQFVIASSDGAYVAENPAIGSDRRTPATVIRKVGDGSVAATLDPSLWLLAFSSDDALALVSSQPKPNAGQSPSHLAVMDWRTGQVIWSYDARELPYASMPQPGGRGFAVALQNGAIYDVVIVRDDGTSTTIESNNPPPWQI